MTSTPPPPPPGWYEVDGIKRWWDGKQWTDAAPPNPPKPSAAVVTTPATVKKKGIGCGGGCLIVVVIFVALIGILAAIGAATSNSPEGRAQDDQLSAQVTCEDLVKQNLKAPSTASFSNEDSTGSDPITVTGDVDAQNGFGAKIRNTFTCTTTGTGDNLEVRLVSLDAN